MPNLIPNMLILLNAVSRDLRFGPINKEHKPCISDRPTDLILAVPPLLLDPGEDGAGAEAVTQPLAQSPGGRGGPQGARDVTAATLLVVDAAERTERVLHIFVILWDFKFSALTHCVLSDCEIIDPRDVINL